MKTILKLFLALQFMDFYQIFVKRIIPLCILGLICLDPSLLAQTAKVEYFSPWANVTFSKTVSSQTSYNRGIETKVGYEYISDLSYKFYRKGLNFSIGSIPQNATISNCEQIGRAHV